MNLKTILITLSCFAVLLILVTFYVVFYSGGGTYVVGTTTSDGGIFATGTAAQTGVDDATSSTASSTLTLASSSASSTASSSSTATEIDAPLVTWTQGGETLSITDTLLSGTQLTLGVQVAMGPVGECVPLNMRMIADEQGDLSPPITPQFTFPDTGTCTGTPGETYSAQPIVFTLNTPVAFPIVLTTGGVANVLFEVIQNADGSLSAQLPPESD